MAWVASPPCLSVPLPFSSPLVSLFPLSHTPLLASVTATTLAIYDAKTLLPLALHTRLPECIESHGHNIEAQGRHVAVDSATNEKMSLVDVHVRTASDYVLIYHVGVNYGKSLYEVSDEKNPENVLQTSLPLAAGNAKNSLSSMFKSATRTLIHGSSMGSNMASVEHFEHGAADDDQGNEYIPLVRVALVKILRVSAKIGWFWGKSNSRNLIFYNSESQLQLLNTRTFKSETVKLAGCGWYFDTVLLEYNLDENYFLHVNSEKEVALLEFEAGGSELAIKYTFLEKLDALVEKICFSPQSDLVLLKTADTISVYTLSRETSKTWRFLLVTTVVPFAESSDFDLGWSPCGDFFYCIDRNTHFWKLCSRFGRVVFDSAHISADLASITAHHPVSPEDADFCKISMCAVSSNAQCLYLVDEKGQTLYKLNLLRLMKSEQKTPLFHDGNYISRLDSRGPGAFIRVPLPPFAQKLLANMQWINGVSVKKPSKKHTGVFTSRINNHMQLSLSFGNELAISTPICTGSECNQVYWFQFYNHYVGHMNVVDHIWIDEYLLVVNRIQGEVPESQSADYMVDELVLLNTKQSKNGAGGVSFKFDSDLISWRHTFKNQVLQMDVSGNADVKTLTLVTHDMKIIIIDMGIGSIGSAEEEAKISIKVRRTIHLSSIRHKLPIASLRDMFTVEEKHFFFLMDNGDCYLLKNQISDTVNGNSRRQTSNMYDLVKVNTAVERFQIHAIQFGENESSFVTLYKGDTVLIYDLKELLDRPHEFEGVENPDDINVEQVLQPVRTLTSTFTSVQICSNGTIAISGFEYQVLWKNENLIMKHRPGRLSILGKFIHRDLFDAGFDKHQINRKYSGFGNYAYCLELLLFEQLEFIDQEGSFDKVCELVNANRAADTIYVNFLRKIEVHYWDKFFIILHLTPIEFMDKLICSQNVDLCYNYLSIYLNFKREHECAGSPDDDDTLLGEREQAIIMEIVAMLKNTEKWDECFELCRFLKLLEPSGKLLRRVRARIA